MRTFRQILFWLHLAAGLIAGVVIFIMCVTGALLAFERQTIEWAERDVRYVAVRSEPRLEPADVLDRSDLVVGGLERDDAHPGGDGALHQVAVVHPPVTHHPDLGGAGAPRDGVAHGRVLDR